MNINYIKEDLRKRITSVLNKNTIDKKLLSYLKEKTPLYVDGSGITKNQQNKKKDISMNYYSKTDYWRPLVTNSESVDNTTNPYFRNPCAQYIAEDKP